MILSTPRPGDQDVVAVLGDETNDKFLGLAGDVHYGQLSIEVMESLNVEHAQTVYGVDAPTN